MPSTQPVFPALATCSYTGFQPEMGTPVRITRSAPRFIKLPDPRYGNFPKWPHIDPLRPGADYFNKGLPKQRFKTMYLADLDRQAAAIERLLLEFPPYHARPLVLLCFERDVEDPLVCHRRLFAEWWQARTGAEVPELGGGL